jgi:hypothetical protein
MTDTTVVEERPDDTVAPVGASTAPEQPADTPAPEQTLDDILSEFDKATAQPTPDPGHVGEIDQILAAYGDTSKLDAQNEVVDSLRGEIDALKAAEYERQEQAAFDRYAGEVQSRLPKHLPEDYAKASMLAAAAQDPNLLAAWRYRNVDRNAADQEFRRLEALHRQISLAPDDPRKAETLRQLEAQGWQIGLAMNAKDILRRAERDLIRRAEEHKVYDHEATQTRLDVAQAMRGASAKLTPEPPPRLGNLSDNEYRNYLKELGISGF